MLWIIAGIVAALLFLGLTGVLLFAYDMPLAGRGAGLFLLAGELKVAALLLSEKIAPALASPWVDRALIALLVVAIGTILLGLGRGH
jgi:hypothetical protein